MHPARSKHPTRGDLRILRDNADIQDTFQPLAVMLALIRLMVTGLYTVADIKPNLKTESYWSLFVSNFTVPILLLIISLFVKKISAPLYSNTPQRVLISPGYDLNMEGGWGEHLLAVTIIIALAHLLSAILNIFWYILLLLPVRGVILIWKQFLRPILIQIFTESESEGAGKKNKKKNKKTKKKVKYRRTIQHYHHFR